MSKWSECAHASGVWRVCARAPAHAAFTRGVGVNAWRRSCLKRGADRYQILISKWTIPLMHEEIIFKGQTQYTPYSDTALKRTNSVYSYIQYVLCEGFPSSPFHFFCSSEFYRSISHCSQKYPLGAAESHDGMTTNQRSRGGAVMFAYGMISRDVKRAEYTPTDMFTLC